jgi:hypothetical protein
VVSIAIFVGFPVSAGVVVNGMFVYCGLRAFTPLNDPLPVKGEPAVTSSERKPVYVSMLEISRETSTPPTAVWCQLPVSNVYFASLWLATTSVC